MFGYIRPLQGELKVFELERFKACYCGLCHSLGKNYGVAARFILNYELVFLSMLLWERDDPIVIKRKPCIAGSCRSKRFCAANTALDTCAGYSVILTWWKLKDNSSDESFLKSIPYRLASLMLFRAYKKASKEFPDFDGKVRAELAALVEYESEPEPKHESEPGSEPQSALKPESESGSESKIEPEPESGGGKSLDEAADKFATILTAAAAASMPDNKRRPMREVLYHTGRWIYILDAYDDYKDDAKAGRFNPIASRFATNGGGLPDEIIQRLEATLTHSNNLVCSAFELLPENAWTQIVSNIVYLGMPYIRTQVLDGVKLVKRRKHGNGIDI